MKNPVVYFEIGCFNGSETRNFFSQLFDWEISDAASSLMINTGGGIDGHITELAAEWGNYITVYVQVDDLKAHLQKVKELGGKVLVEPVSIPGQGSFAWFAAPEGNIMALWQSV